MNSILLICLVALVAMMFVNNMKRIKKLQNSNGYVEAYLKILKGDEDGEAFLNDYIEKETNDELINRAKIVKLYQDMLNGTNPINAIDEIDFTKAFGQEYGISVEEISQNSDVFIWLVMNMTKAKSMSLIDVMDKLYEKVTVFEENFNKTVEYNIFKASYELILEKSYDSKEFLFDLLEGNYTDYAYDKQLIGVFKKMAASLLDYSGEELSEEYEVLLKDFAVTQVGNKMLKNLGTIDKFYKEEKTEE